MLVRLDIGLPNPVVLVVVFVIIPVIVFIMHRKWWDAAARREEVQRLLIFASEEAARAEIEATEGYFHTANTSSSFPTPDSAWVPPIAPVPVAPALRPLFQCAVCFSSTTTRCAKCKAVRYCSGRCQIVHWRQGHKDECLPYVAVKPVTDVSFSSLKQEDSKDFNNVFTDNNQPEIRSVFESTSETSSEYSTFSTSSSRSSTEDSSSSVDGDHSSVKDSKPFEKSNHLVNKSVTSPVSNPKNGLASHSTKPVTTINKEEHKVAKLTQHSGSGRNGLKTSFLKFVDQIKPSQKIDTDASHKYSCKSLFSYEMFVKFYNWKQVELQPFGLINCGNSCYANSVLQCLIYTPPLYVYLLQGLHSKTCDKRDNCFTCEFEGLVLKAKNGNSSLSPMRILSQIENIGRGIGRGREEDAHEFLRYAVNALQSVCLKEVGTNATNSLEEETTLIGLTFGGYLRSKIQCMKCGGKSEQHEQMMDLTVEIEGSIGTLEEALNKFTRTELLDGENKYKCSRCKSYEKAKKKLTLLEAPNVLTIALKRFQSGKFGKVNKSVDFPEILNMAPYVRGTSDKSPVYGLYGAVVHVDTMNDVFSGHYVCYVKNIKNRWFKIDDNVVKEVDVQCVLTKNAYILLYARCSPRAPRIIRGGLLSRHNHNPKKHKTTTSRSHSTQPWTANHDPLAIRHRTLEEESSSSSDGSGMFSESCSSSIEDNISWRNMYSDSDTSSSGSFPSPLYSRHSMLYNNDECRKVSCSSSCRETNCLYCTIFADVGSTKNS